MAETTLTFSPNAAQLHRVDALLGDIAGGVNKALVAAVNQTMRSFKTQLTDLLGDVLLAKRGEILDSVKLNRGAYQGKAGVHLEGTVTVSRSHIAMHDFKTKYTKRSGATSQFVAGGPVQQFNYVFRARMQTGHVGAFQRIVTEGKSAPGKGTYAGRKIKRGPRKGQPVTRQRIKEMFGPSAVTAIEKNPSLLQTAQDKLEETFDKVLESKIDWMLKTAGR